MQGWQKPHQSKKYVRGFLVIWVVEGFSEVFLYLKFKNKKIKKKKIKKYIYYINYII